MLTSLSMCLPLLPALVKMILHLTVLHQLLPLLLHVLWRVHWIGGCGYENINGCGYIPLGCIGLKACIHCKSFWNSVVSNLFQKFTSKELVCSVCRS